MMGEREKNKSLGKETGASELGKRQEQVTGERDMDK